MVLTIFTSLCWVW